MNMKYIYLFLIAGLTSCSFFTNQEAEVEEDNAPEQTTYGANVEENKAIDIRTMMKQLEGKDSAYVAVKGEITATCKMKGCWMKIQLPDENEMRVSFKDYSFFVPKEGVEGKTAVFEGYVKRSVISEEERRHFARDEGKSEEEINSISGVEEKLSFVADGVIIYN